MQIKVKSYSSQSSLISSIIFFIIGAIMFVYADELLNFISIGIGVLLATIGIIELVIFLMQRKREEGPNKRHLIVSIVTLILSIIFIFFSGIVEQFIRFIVGAWILFSGIMRLINVISSSPKNKKFLPLLIVSALLIALGIYSIISEGVIGHITGVIIMLYATIEIIGFIFYTKDTQVPEEPGTTTLIVPDPEVEEKDKTKNVKTVKDVKETKSKKKDKEED